MYFKKNISLQTVSKKKLLLVTRGGKNDFGMMRGAEAVWEQQREGELAMDT